MEKKDKMSLDEFTEFVAKDYEKNKLRCEVLKTLYRNEEESLPYITREAAEEILSLDESDKGYYEILAKAVENSTAFSLVRAPLERTAAKAARTAHPKA